MTGQQAIEEAKRRGYRTDGDVQPELIEQFMATTAGASAADLAVGRERIIKNILRAEPYIVNGQRVSAATWAAIADQIVAGCA